ncbi:MAG TPA: glutamate formimidoyltransferase [Vicinamibacterales bacterium]|nr:glutamate formimidoyltransferase [Vicinamibacterales bacterium]
MPVLECVPNISEGRDLAAIRRIADAVAATPGVRLLDVHSDATHHRSVFTIIGTAAALRAAVLALFEATLAVVDLAAHHGAHPRIGAVDVVPFVPLAGATMAEAIAAARETAAGVAERFGVPVFLYERAATRPERHALQDVRRGQFEGLHAKLRRPEWQPDYGPPVPHPRLGAVAIGARDFLVAYNINLATARLDVATRIARVVRESSGGLPCVKAMGLALPDRGIVQVSMNLTDIERTSLATVFEVVSREAARDDVDVVESEVVGLVPGRALVEAAARHLRLPRFGADRVLDTHLGS